MLYTLKGLTYIRHKTCTTMIYLCIFLNYYILRMKELSVAKLFVQDHMVDMLLRSLVGFKSCDLDNSTRTS